MGGRCDIEARVVSHQELGYETFLMRLVAPEIVETARPGQFLMIRSRLENGHDPLLRRPFSIHRCDPEGGTLEVLYRVVGRGTRWMATVREGMLLKLLGPLGRGFRLENGRIPILVGGGMGIAPLMFLADVLKGERGVIVLGAATRALLFRLDAFAATGLELLISTEDGSLGDKGLVTGLLDRLLDRLEGRAVGNVVVLSCGPMPMLRSLARTCEEHRVECQVCLEAQMACGLGLCLGCAVKAVQGGYLHVCQGGPVFLSTRVQWDALP